VANGLEYTFDWMGATDPVSSLVLFSESTYPACKDYLPGSKALERVLLVILTESVSYSYRVYWVLIYREPFTGMGICKCCQLITDARWHARYDRVKQRRVKRWTRSETQIMNFGLLQTITIITYNYVSASRLLSEQL
jgi:hypothetical protein